jgi:hypothetical protein
VMSVELTHGVTAETHPVAYGMLTDGLNTINSRWLARAAECVQAAKLSGQCQVLTITFHVVPCDHGRAAIP